MSYIRKSNDMIIDVRNNPMGDPGSIISQNLANSDEKLLNKRRMFKKNTLNKGCGVGYHIHKGDAEFYYILSGEGEYNDNGNITTVRTGDLTYTGPGEGHSLINYKDEPLSFIALILYE